MMSKKQWFVLLCLLIIYILLGAVFFYQIETREEAIKREGEKEERRIIEELLHKHYIPNEADTEEEIFEKLQHYCGKPMHSNVTEDDDPPKWDFYHSVFFVMTVVTTVGYGNLAPTTMLGRMVMIFYALIGMPINALIMVTLGDFFGKSFINLYERWKLKSSKMHYDTARLGLIGQIILYLVPGFTFFIFLPSFIISAFEGWDYNVAVYYAFVTLTTIGFGDIVAGVNKPGQKAPMYLVYKLFLLVWIIIGLGYVVMVLGFIARGLRSKRMHAIEHALAMNLKRTPQKIRQELRGLVHEFLLMKVKRVYKSEFVYTPTNIERSQSCPDLTDYRQEESPSMQRKRAFSECIQVGPLLRVQSESDLSFIDMERTFTRKMSEHNSLLLRVANALGTLDDECDDLQDVLSQASVKSSTGLGVPFFRKRACSEVKFPFSEKISQDNNLTWYGKPNITKLEGISEEGQHGKTRSRTLPIQTPNFFSKIKNTITGNKEDEKPSKDFDVEKQDLPPMPRNRLYSDSATSRYLNNTRNGRHSMFPRTDSVLEDTSLADFLRILTDITDEDENQQTPTRKLGLASLTPPDLSPSRSRRAPIRPPIQVRKGSLMPPSHNHPGLRRFSLRANSLVDPTPLKKLKVSTLPIPSISTSAPENFAPPPPYTPFAPDVPGRRSIRAPGSNRRYSLRPVTNFVPSTSPVQRQVKRKEESKDSFNEKL